MPQQDEQRHRLMHRDGGTAEMCHEALHPPVGDVRCQERLQEIPGQPGAHKQERQRTPKRAERHGAEREPWISHHLLEADGRVDLCITHGCQEETTPKGATQGGCNLEERAAGSFFDEAGAASGSRSGEPMSEEKPDARHRRAEKLLV